MPRVVKEIERKRVEKVAESIECDACGRKSKDHGTAEGPVDWDDGLTTSCWMFDNDGGSPDQEIILCPDCFRGLKVAMPFVRALMQQKE